MNEYVNILGDERREMIKDFKMNENKISNSLRKQFCNVLTI